MDTKIPEGFVQMPTVSPYFKHVGPFYFRKTPESYSMGMVTDAKHIRGGNFVAGGVLFTLSDVAQGHAVATALWPEVEDLRRNQIRLVTVSLNNDCVSSAPINVWIQADVEITKVGTNVCFSRAVIKYNEKVLITSTATYVVRPE